MTSQEMQLLLASTFQTLQHLSATKGADYAGTEDRLSNFKRLGAELNLQPELVLWVYLTKHLDAIRTYLRRYTDINYQPSEPIDGRIDDAILYLILLKGLLNEPPTFDGGAISKAVDSGLVVSGGVRTAA